MEATSVGRGQPPCPQPSQTPPFHPTGAPTMHQVHVTSPGAPTAARLLVTSSPRRLDQCVAGRESLPTPELRSCFPPHPPWGALCLAHGSHSGGICGTSGQPGQNPNRPHLRCVCGIQKSPDSCPPGRENLAVSEEDSASSSPWQGAQASKWCPWVFVTRWFTLARASGRTTVTHFSLEVWVCAHIGNNRDIGGRAALSTAGHGCP